MRHFFRLLFTTLYALIIMLSMKPQEAVKILDDLKNLVEVSGEVPPDMQNSIGAIIGTYRDQIKYVQEIDPEANNQEFDFEVEYALLKIIIHTIEAARK